MFMSRGKHCFFIQTGTIQHEFLHALGFGHEHERPDRDDFVRVNLKYILQTYIHNFDKEPHPTYSSNIPYDLASVMHYSLNVSFLQDFVYKLLFYFPVSLPPSTEVSITALFIP